MPEEVALVQDDPRLCLNDEKRASGQIEGLDGVFPNRAPVGLFCVPRMYSLLFAGKVYANCQHGRRGISTDADWCL
jgi:hypothetical protein